MRYKIMSETTGSFYSERGYSERGAMALAMTLNIAQPDMRWVIVPVIA